MPLQMLITDPVCFEDGFTGVVFWFIAEYVEQGALFDFLHRNEFDSTRNLQWAREIAAGKGLVHLALLLCCSQWFLQLFPG